jgi:DNA (cytosine-5)-methyltransferase 1
MVRGVITDGEVDSRPIQSISADDVRRFRRVHLFAGIGVWDYSLNCARWEQPCWTASCPCPPFSAAGQKKACPECGGESPVPHVGRTGYFVCSICQCEWLADERHLYPELWRLVRDGRPAALFGEQVASKDGRVWLASVRASLEILGYAVGSANLCSAGVGGSDIRQRLYWMAYAKHSERRTEHQELAEAHRRNGFGRSSDAGRLGHSERARLEGHAGNGDQSNESRWIGENTTRSASETSAVSGLADSNGGQSRNGTVQRSGEYGLISQDGETMWLADSMQPGRSSWGSESGNGSTPGSRGIVEHTAADALKGFWRDADWLLCTDGFWRPVEAGTFPLAHGSPCRLGRLRGFGDAINAEVAKVFIEESSAVIANRIHSALERGL